MWRYFHSRNKIEADIKCGGTAIPLEVVQAASERRFGDVGSAFGGWMIVLMVLTILGALLAVLAILGALASLGRGAMSFELSSFIILVEVVWIVVALLFLRWLYYGENKAYVAFILTIALELLALFTPLILGFGVATSMFVPLLIGVIFRASIWLQYFKKSERVFEHFGTNFPQSS